MQREVEAFIDKHGGTRQDLIRRAVMFYIVNRNKEYGIKEEPDVIP